MQPRHWNPQRGAPECQATENAQQSVTMRISQGDKSQEQAWKQVELRKAMQNWR